MTNIASHQTIQGASLWAVPSVHFCMSFAEEVNQLCSREKPDAVVVELGSQTATAAAAWLRELGVGSGLNRPPFPCMLGLTRINRRIRPSRRETAVRLQEITGKELNELPADILYDVLDYSAISVLYLSPTDSIIEAVRCALELKVPLYGVDLEETAGRQHKETMIQDPTLASREMRKYVERNGVFAEYHRDEEIDVRRETAMAARLKFLLEKHRRIVFVCGLAHWRQLQKLMQSDEIRPAAIVESTGDAPSHLRRAIIHPLLAIHYLDKFPAFAAAYENDRPNSMRPPTLRRPQDARRLFIEILRASYEKHFLRAETDEQLDRVLEDWEAQADFEQLLQNLCLIHQRQAPDLFTALRVAQGAMSKKFCRTFGETLMEFRWTRPDEFPDLPILAPAPSVAGQPLKAEFIDREGRRSRWFYVHSLPERSGIATHVPIPWEWTIEPPLPVPPERDGINANWVPFDTLMDALAFRAVRIARDQTYQARAELFEGSLLEGVDMKATLRSATRKEDRIFVRSSRRRLSAVSPADEDIEGFPVVWILRLANSTEVFWKFSSDNVSKLRTFRNRSAEWDQLGLPSHGLMITSVMAITDSHTDSQLSQPDYNVIRETRVGQINFQPQCCVRRTAEWAEESKLAFNPVLPQTTLDALTQFYHERFSWDFGEHAWHTNLIRLAIPMARKAITVIAPDGYSAPSIVYREAARCRIQVRIVPLSYFPSEALRKISQIVWLPTLARTQDEVDLPIFPEHVMRHFNEPMDRYHRLIPKLWR